MSNVINLSDDGLKALNSGLDKLVASMDKLDRSLSKISNKTTFEQLFGKAEDFDKITKAISTLTYSGVKNFEAMSASIRILVKDMTDMANGKFSTRAIGEMFSAIATINGSRANLAKVHTVLADVKGFIAEGIKLAAAADSGSVQSFLRIGTAIGAIGSGFRALNELKDASGKAAQIDVKPIIKLINEIAAIKFDGNVDSLASVASFLKSVISFSSINFQELSRTIGYLQVTLDQIAGLRLPKIGKINLMAEVLLKFSKGLKGVDDALKTASVNKLTNVNGFASSLQQLGQLFATIDTNKGFLNNAGRLALSFVKNVIGLGVIVPGLILFLGVFTKVLGLLATLSIPVDVGITSLANNLKLMGTAFEAISTSLAGGFKGKAGASFSQNVGTFASNILGTLGAILKVGVVFPLLTAVLTGVFKGLGLLIKYIPGDDALTTLTKSIQRVGQTFVNIVDALGGNSLGSKMASLTKSSEAVNNIATGIKNVVAVAFNIIKIGVVFPVLATGLVVIFKALSLIAAIPFGNEALTKVTTSVKTVALAFVAINEAFGGRASGIGSGLLSAIGNVLKVGVIFPLLATQLVVVFKALGLFSSIAPGSSAAVANTIKSFAEVIGVVANSKIDVGAFRKAAAGFKAIGDSIGGLTKSLVKKGQLEAFIGVGETISKILQGLVTINGAVQAVSLTGILKLRLIFAAIGGAIKSAVSGLQDSNPELLKNFGVTAERLGSAVRQIGLALKQREGVKLIGILDIIKILLTFRTLLNMVKTIGKGSDASSISAVAGTLDGLGRVFRTIFKSFEVKSGETSTTGLIAGRQRIDLISTIFDKIKKFKNAKLPDLEGTFTGLTKLFSFLNKIQIDSAQTEALKKYLNTILGELTRVNKIKVNKNVAEGLTALSKLLSGLNVPASGGGVGSLNGIASLFESLKKVKLSKDELNNFKDFIKVLATGLKKLEKITVSPDVAKTIEAIALSLKNLGGTSTDTAFRDVNIDSVGLEAGQGFANSVEKGILQANLRLFLGKLFLGAIAVLNPIAIGNAIIQGVTAGFGAIASLKAKLLDAITSAGTQLKQLGSNLKSFGSNLFSSLGLGAVSNSNAFKLATDFDALSTQVQVFGNLTQEQTKKAQDFANMIGIKYPQSSNEALQGILNLQKAGLGLDQIFSALPAAADLASVSDTKDLDATSKALIQVTQSFKEFGPGVAAAYSNASYAADILARSANASTASVESLTAGLANVGPVATNFGLDLQTTTAILALFEDRGIKGAEAGTQLKSLLTSLTGGSKETTTALKQLGVSIVDQNGNYKDFNTIINDLNHAMNDTKTISVSTAKLSGEQKQRLDLATKAYAAATRQILIYQDGLATGALDQDTANKKLAELAKVQQNAQGVITELTGSQKETERITKEITRTQAQNAAAIKKIAGSYGQAGLSILINAGDDAIKNFIDTTGRLPSAAEAASLLLNNLKGDMEQLRGSVETLLTRALLPLIGRAFRPLVQLGRTVVDFFNNLPDSVIDVATNVILLVSGVASLISGFSIAAGIALQFSGALISGVGILLTMGLNMGLVVGAAIGLVASFATLIVVGGAIVSVLAAVGAGISFFFRQIETNSGGAGDAFNQVKEALSSVLDSVGIILRTGGDIIGFLIGDGLSSSSVEQGQKLATFFTSIANSLKSVQGKLKDVQNFITTFKDFLNLVSGADLKGNALASLAGEGLGVGNALKIADQQVKNLTSSVNGMAVILGRSGLIQALFGRSLTGEEIIGIFSSIKQGLLQVRDAAIKVFGGLTGTLLDALGISNSPESKAQLKEGLATIGALLTAGLQNLTGLDLSKSLLSFQAGDLATGAKNLLTSLLDALGTVISNNEAGITNVLSTIFGFFVPGKSLVPLILRTLGLNSLADKVKGVFDTIDSAFRAGIATIFDIMRGQNLEEALIGNFGKNIKPVIRAIKSLGSTIGNIAGLFTDLFAALFPPSQSKMDAGGFLGSFFTGVADAVDGFNSIVVTPLRSALPAIISLLGRVLSFVKGVAGGIFTYLGGIAAPISNLIKDLFSGSFDVSSLGTRIPEAILSTLANVFTGLPGLIGSLLSSLGDLFGSPILNKIGDDLKAGDISGAIATLTTAVQDVVTKAIAAVPDLLINLGTTFGAPIFTKLGEALKTGDFTGFAQTIATTLGNVLGTIPDLLIDLGTTFSSPLLTKLGQDLLNADPGAFIGDIVGAASTAIQTAIGSIPTRLAELGVVLNLDFLKNINVDPATSAAFQSIIDALKRLVDLPLATVKSIADNLKPLAEGIKGILDGTNSQGAQNLKDLAAVLGVLGGALVLFGPISLLLPLITGGLTGIFTALQTAGGFLVKFAGIAAVLIIIKNAISGLADVFSGKTTLGTAIGDFFFNIGKDALKLFGVNKIFGQDFDQIKTTWNNLFTIIGTVAQRVFGGIRDFFTGIIDNIQVRLALLQAQVNLASPDEATRKKASAVIDLNQLAGGGDLSGFADAIGKALKDGVDPETIKAIGRNNADALLEGFHSQIDGNFTAFIGPGMETQFEKTITALATSNKLDEAFASIPADSLAPFLQRLLTVNPATLDLLDFNQVSGVLESAVQNGSISIDLAKAFVYKIPDTVLSPAEKEAFFKKLQEDLGLKPDGPPATTGDTPVVETTIGVDPKPVVAEDKKTGFFADVQTALTEGAPVIGADPIPVEAPVDPVAVLAASEIKTPADAAAMAENLALVKEQADLTTPSLATLTFASTVLSGILNALVNTSLNAVKTNIDGVRIAATNLAVGLPAQMLSIGIAFTVGAAAASLALDPLITKLDTVKTKINEIAGALGALGNGGADVNTGKVNPGGKVPGRADGGDVFAGRLYEVAERGISELLQIGGRTYLIPGQNGTVVPPVAPPVAGRGGGNNSVVNNSQADNSIGTVQIIIQGGTSLTQEQLAAATTQGLNEYQRSNPLGRRLTLAGKT